MSIINRLKEGDDAFITIPSINRASADSVNLTAAFGEIVHDLLRIATKNCIVNALYYPS